MHLLSRRRRHTRWPRDWSSDVCSSDLVTGISIYNPKKLEFEFRAGPILGNVVLADEINRTSPKTQASMLEAMEERSVTVRSEERRVGNKYRSRRAAEPSRARS